MFIYKVTNKINNKSYIGQTTKSIHAISNGGKYFYMKDKEGNIIWSGIIMSECARRFNLSIGNVSECLKGNRQTHKGFKFEYGEL